MNNTKQTLHPYWVTGFVDAEGCFYVRISKSKDTRTGWTVQAIFLIQLHVRDKDLLLQIKSFFGDIGNIYTKNNVAYYRVSKLNDITNIILPHFDNFPLITQKQSDFLLFKNIIELMNKGDHLKKDYLIKIASFKAILNNGLSDKLKTYFPNIIKMKKVKIDLPRDIDLNWVAGFFSGEGCFYINIYKSKSHKVNYGIYLQIILTQHSKDKLLMNKLISILKCGNVYDCSNENIVELRISKFEDINDKIIPIFNKYEIIGVKSLDFEDFCKVAETVKKGSHITLEGLE